MLPKPRDARPGQRGVKNSEARRTMPCVVCFLLGLASCAARVPVTISADSASQTPDSEALRAAGSGGRGTPAKLRARHRRLRPKPGQRLRSRARRRRPKLRRLRCPMQHPPRRFGLPRRHLPRHLLPPRPLRQRQRPRKRLRNPSQNLPSPRSSFGRRIAPHALSLRSPKPTMIEHEWRNWQTHRI